MLPHVADHDYFKTYINSNGWMMKDWVLEYLISGTLGF
jgi:hypothetical protein